MRQGRKNPLVKEQIAKPDNSYQTYTILHPNPGMAHNIMSSFKTGSVVVVSNPHPDSFARLPISLGVGS